MYRSLFVASLALSIVALAQTASVGTGDLHRGVTLLPTSVATTDEATSLVYNPAALGRSGAFNAWFLHEKSNTRGINGDGLWLSTAIANFVGIGVGAEWLGTTNFESRRWKSSLGLSVGPKAMSVGLSVNHLRGQRISSLSTVDVGLQSQPLRWLGFGAVVRNVTMAANAALAPSREYTVGLGLRPFKEYVTLGVDFIAVENQPMDRSQLQYTLSISPRAGLRLLGGLSHSVSMNAPLQAQVALGFDFDHLGYTQGLGAQRESVDWQFAARLSWDAHPSLISRKKIAVVSVADLGEPTTGTLGLLLGIGAEDRYLHFLQFLRKAANDPELALLVLKIEGADLGLARADEIRGEIANLRAAGKKVFAYVFNAGDAEYLMASSCDGIYAAPESMLMVDGLRSNVLFVGGTAEQLGITVDVARVGAYKNFPDQFTRKDMSEEQRESIAAFLDGATLAVEQRIGAHRNVKIDAWRKSVDRGLVAPAVAMAQGQIDGVFTPKQFDELLKEKAPNASIDRNYRPNSERSTRWGAPRKIAVIPVLGSISGGKNRVSPFVGERIAGAASFIAAIEAAADDPSIAGIVIRVDSGGGDGLASDLMYRAVLEAKKKKPVVASMGDAAASGGYYVSMGADEIFASATTLTGSIGVFFMKPAVRQLAERWGTTQVSISRGANAGITDYFDPWTPEQRQTAQAWVDSFYDTFITEVAASRHMTKAQVDAIARGRVWSGEAAKSNGLVDRLGGLHDAVDAAMRRAGVAAADVEVTMIQPNTSLVSSVIDAAVSTSILETKVSTTASLTGPPAEIMKQLGFAHWLLEAPAVQARMEYSVEIK